MARLVAEYEPQTVAELQAILTNLPYEMPVSDAMGELLCLRIYEDDGTGEQFMEVF